MVPTDEKLRRRQMRTMRCWDCNRRTQNSTTKLVDSAPRGVCPDCAPKYDDVDPSFFVPKIKRVSE